MARASHQAVGAQLQLQQLGGAPPSVPLHPRKARADDEQQPRLSGERESAVDLRLGHQLAEHDHVRLQDRAAARARRHAAFLDEARHLLERHPLAATETARGPNRAVHLDHLAATGQLVQAVDVLRHNRRHEPPPLELGQRAVRGVRLRRREHPQPLGVEVPDLDRVAPEGVDGRVLHRVVARPDAGGRAEVRDAAVGADARPREHHDPLSGIDPTARVGDQVGVHVRHITRGMKNIETS